MAIKQISKTYRSMCRAFNQFEAALTTIKTADPGLMVLTGYTEAATQLSNACKSIEKILLSLGWSNLDSTTWFSWWKGMTEERFTLNVLQDQEGRVND